MHHITTIIRDKEYGIYCSYYRPAISGNWSEPPRNEDIDFEIIDLETEEVLDIELTLDEINRIKRELSEHRKQLKKERDL